MTPEEYFHLFEKFRNGACTSEEEEQLIRYQDSFRLLEEDSRKETAADRQLKSRIYQRIAQTIHNRPTAKIHPIRWWSAAAAVGVIVAGLVLWQTGKGPQTPVLSGSAAKAAPNNRPVPITPGSNKAILTLGNGDTIVLDDAADGLVAQTGGTAIKKLKKGWLSYSADAQQLPGAKTAGTAGESTLNTIAVPRGGQYMVALPDGTKAWLNSASSLTFPVRFNTTERRVTLKGEGYFEVSKDEQKPFVVDAGLAEVKVLGTEFNINAYSDEKDVKTTLLSGSVRVFHDGGSALLDPGEQGIVAPSRPGIVRKKVKVSQVVAWKTGYFVFTNNTIQDIMRQIARWYDVDIEYEGAIPQGHFGGTYSKEKDIQQLLKALEITGSIHFKIIGRRIIVMT
jgi:ferric-dicitrate binding protein FerR (iron transport regulator)